MSKIVEYINLLLWIIFLFLDILKEINNEKIDFKMIIKEPFNFVRIDCLFFLSIFLIYHNFARSEVLPFLYLIIIITNIVYLVYDLKDNYKISNISPKEYIYFIVGIILIISIILYQNISDNYLKTLIITLIINCFMPIIVSLVKLNKKH